MAFILVIDDDADIRTWLKTVLGRAGHQVEEAKEGAAGLALFQRQAADLVFCDLFMPGTDGLETIRELRRTSPYVPIVAMSGGGCNGRLDVLPVARVLGATQVLRKPFGTEELLVALAQVLTATPGG